MKFELRSSDALSVWLNSLSVWLPPIVAVVLTALFSLYQFNRRQKLKNNHVLHALWKESELVYIDCKNWQEAKSTPQIIERVKRNAKYQPASISYDTNQSAINTIIHDMPGISERLVKAAIEFHYCDSSAIGVNRFISSENWPKLNRDQKVSILKAADSEVEGLLEASKKFHGLLSDELRVRQSDHVSPNTRTAWSYIQDA